MKFFLVLRPFPGYGFVALVAVTIFGAISIAWSPGELDSALGLLLFVQMFLASSGFVATAHRGHFDPVLSHGRSRPLALAAQWCASVMPGLAAWLLLALADLAVGGAEHASAFGGARLAALFIVSAVAWCLGFALPRGAGGVLWMGGLLWLLLRSPDLLGWAGDQTTSQGIIRTAAAIVLCPFLLIGRASVGTAAIAAGAGMSATALLITWRAGTRLDAYLVDRS